MDGYDPMNELHHQQQQQIHYNYSGLHQQQPQPVHYDQYQQYQAPHQDMQIPSQSIETPEVLHPEHIQQNEQQLTHIDQGYQTQEAPDPEQNHKLQNDLSEKNLEEQNEQLNSESEQQEEQLGLEQRNEQLSLEQPGEQLSLEQQQEPLSSVPDDHVQEDPETETGADETTEDNENSGEKELISDQADNEELLEKNLENGPTNFNDGVDETETEENKTNGIVAPAEVILMEAEAADGEVEDVLEGVQKVKPIKVKDIMKERNEAEIEEEEEEEEEEYDEAASHKRSSRPRAVTPLDTSVILDEKDKRGEEIDEEQCRICLSKDDLISIFQAENRQTIADKIMTICTGVRIQRKDFLPQFVCNTCMQSVQVAFNLKRLCETTEKDLRSKLSRSKKNVRRPPTEYVLLDATKFDPETDPETPESDDEDFHISNDEMKEEPDDSADSDYGKRRSKRVRNRKPQPRRRAPQKATPSRSKSRSAPSSKSSSKPGPKSFSGSAVKRHRSDSSPEKRAGGGGGGGADFSSGSDDDFSPPKKRASRPGGGGGSVQRDHPCPWCSEVFPSNNALQKHKRVHSGAPMNCELCGKNFKLFPAFQAHLAKHKEDGDSLACTKCEKTFQKLAERRKHMMEEHGEKPETFPCEKCKRVFSHKKSLEKHLDGKCPGPRKLPNVSQPLQKSKGRETENVTLGRDLFKCVAPLTTTYWSDSFSD